MFSVTLIFISIFLGLSGVSVLSVWAMFELNLLSFLMMMFSQKSGHSVLSKYFVSQSLGSLLFLIAVIFSLLGSEAATSMSLMELSLVLKLGMAPLHWWIIRIFPRLEWEMILLLSTVQKILPLYFFMKIAAMKTLLLISINVIMGTLGLISQKRLKMILAYFSMISGSWLLVASPNLNLSFFYLFAFTMALVLLTVTSGGDEMQAIYSSQVSEMSAVSRLSLSVAALSMSGFPPTLGFYAKLVILLISLFSCFTSSLVLLAASPLIMYSLISLVLMFWKVNNLTSWEKEIVSSPMVSAVLSAILISGAIVILSSSKSA